MVKLDASDFYLILAKKEIDSAELALSAREVKILRSSVDVV